MATSKRKSLPLSDKVQVVNLSEKGTSACKIAQQFGVSKTQIQSIILNKVMRDFEDGAPAEKKRKMRQTGNERINELMYDWFKTARLKNIPLSGSILQEKALLFASKLNNLSFKASNGWLESFRQCHGIKFHVLSGESADVDEGLVTGWTDRLPSLCEGYQLKDIFYVDESGFFYRELPEKSLTLKGEQCKGRKKSKERLTAMFCCSLTGEKLKPLIIGKADRPRCFKNLNVAQFPALWLANRCAWMTSSLFEEWLHHVNNKMKREKRSILLFLDNAPCHPELSESLSNIKLQFFPPNMTSKLHLLDQGIIRHVKVIYRKKLLLHVLAHMDDIATALDISRSVNVLSALTWIAQAWDETPSDIISKCFAHAGFPMEGSDVTVDDVNLSELTSLAYEISKDCSTSDFSTLDDDLRTYETLREDWEQVLMNMAEGKCSTAEDEEEEAEAEVEDPVDGEPSLIITSYKDAVKSLQDIRSFVMTKSDGADLLGLLAKAESVIVGKLYLQASTARQATLDDFFCPTVPD